MAGDSTTPATVPREERVPASTLLRGLFFFGFVLLILGGGHAYIGRRLIGDPHWPGWATALGWTALVLFGVSVPLSFLLPRFLPGPANRVVLWVANLWMGGFGLLLTATAFADVARALWRLSGSSPMEPEAWARAWAAGVLVTVVAALGWGIRVALGPPKVLRVNIPVENLPPGLEGVRIAQISDLHVGQTHADGFLERVVRTVNALDADLVAVTGDLVDGFVHTLRDEVAPLAQLRGKHGVFYVTGNHEYYWGGEAWETEVRRLGLTVLHNEHRVLNIGDSALVVAGVTDFEGGRFHPNHRPDPARAFQGAPAGPRILLAHQPKAAATLEGLRVDLQLSGHTHAGQMFPFMFFVRLQQPVVAGLARLSGVLTYTNQGTGFWGPPIRLGTFPEITELVLTRA
jgi:uncharacterized protein